MARRHKRRSRRNRRLRLCLSVGAVFVVLLAGAIVAQLLESRMSKEVENAGMQMTSYLDDDSKAQVFMNGGWYEKKNVETLLVMGIDDYGSVESSSSYNNTNQADFLVLYIHDKDTGESSAIHLNRDTMTDFTVLGVTGEAAGTQYGQLALAYNYGRGENDSSRNTADAVSHLLYSMKIDRYITVTMDAVPIMNDWVGGVELEILDDLTVADPMLIKGESVTLQGDQALDYVRTRYGLDDSTNLNRMERQRQYASCWIAQAQENLSDHNAVAQLIVQMRDCHYSDCTADELSYYANMLSEDPTVSIYELPGTAVLGDVHMEFYTDEEKLQQLILDLFYNPVKE